MSIPILLTIFLFVLFMMTIRCVSLKKKEKLVRAIKFLWISLETRGSVRSSGQFASHDGRGSSLTRRSSTFHPVPGHCRCQAGEYLFACRTIFMPLFSFVPVHSAPDSQPRPCAPFTDRGPTENRVLRPHCSPRD